MKPLYSVMGGVALASDKLSRFRINFIPLNWGLIAACLVAGSIFGDNYQREHDVGSLGILVLLLLVAGAFLVSMLLRHTIFQKGAPVVSSAPNAFSGIQPSDADFNLPMRMSGRLRLHEKVARRFLNMPVALVRLQDGQLAFMSNIDASSRLYGAVINSKKGLWLSIPRLDSIQVENGEAYYGFKGAPALRLRYTDGSDGSNACNIVAFTSVQDRDRVRAALESERSRVAHSQQPFAPAMS